MVHKMKTFCCGCTLQTGTVVVAVLAAVSAVCDATNLSLGSQRYLVSLSNFWIVLVVNMILDVARLVTSVLMIRGASSESPRFVRPWYALHLVLLSVFFVHVVISFFYDLSNDDMSDGFINLGGRILLALIYGFGVYTVHCYYQQLQESHGNFKKVLEATQPPQIYVTSEKDIKFERL